MFNTIENKKMKFYIITVIYNQLIESCNIAKESPQKNIAIIFADNSTDYKIQESNESFCKLKDFVYLRMNGNLGLPKAYNKAIQSIPKKKENWIILFDQDTKINVNLIEKYKQFIIQYPDKKVFTPIIKDSVGIMSPAKFKNHKYVHSISIDFNKKIEDYSFINSCMCINSIIFDSIIYDENLFLDYVDYDFVQTIRKRFDNSIFYVITDIEIFQNFSGVTRNSFLSDYNRFKIYSKDLQYFHSKWYGTKQFANRILILRAIKLSIIHKNLKFLRLLNK